MKLSKFVVILILTIITAIIELLVIMGGEKFVILTILSTFPIYFLTRIKTIYGIFGYICISALLLYLNEHQMMFFALTNGLLGICLATFQNRSFKRSNRIVLSALLLSIGVCVCITLIGKDTAMAATWYCTMLLIIFCLIYTAIINWMLAKSYISFRLKCNRYLK